MSNPIKVIKLTGVSGSLEGKADVVHTHVLADITDAGTAAAANTSDFATAAQGITAASALQAADIDTLSELNANFTDGTVLVDDADPRLSDARTPTTHPHTLSDITDSGSAAALDAPTSGDATAAQVVKGNDSRLTGAAYAPVSHTHDIVDLTGVAPTVHTHSIADITDRGTASELDVTISGDASPTQVVKGDDSRLIDDRNPITHTHTVSELLDLATSDITLNTDTDVSTAAWFIDEDNMDSYSDTQVPSQQSVVEYVNSALSGVDGLSGNELRFVGSYDASTNSPNLDGATPRQVVELGDLYVASADGDLWGAAITVGALLIATSNDPIDATGWYIVSAQMPYTAGQIKSLYESVADTEAFTTAEQTKLAALSVITNKLDATADPTATDDSSAGYQIGSVWVNTTTDEAFTCVDATAAAAVWTAGGGGLVDIVEDTTPELGGNLDVGNFGILKSAAPFVSFTSSTLDEFSLDIQSGTSSDYVNNNPTTISVVDNTGSGFYTNNLKLSSTTGSLYGGGAGKVELDNYVFNSNETLSGKSGQVLTYNGTHVTLAPTAGPPSDAVFGTSWNGDTGTATKNAIYDEIITRIDKVAFDAKGDLLVGTAANTFDRLPVGADLKVLSADSSTATGLQWVDAAGGGTTQGSSSTYDISAAARSSTPDARGNYSVDLQMQGNADDVAAGTHSALIGGSFNSAAGTHGFITAGTGNTIPQNTAKASILSSDNCSMANGYGYNSVILAHGGNPLVTTMSAYNSAIIGGQEHTLLGGMGGGGYCAILGGTSNSGSYADRSIILGGTNNNISYSQNCVIAGTRVKATGVPLGRLDGVFAFADNTAADYTITQDKTANFRVANGMHITAPLFITERASALADIAGRGQIWVKTKTAANELFFTDDTGEDMPLSSPVGTVAQLPSTPVQGQRAFVTDSQNSLASHHGQTVNGGAALFVPVYYDGADWIVG